MYDWNSRNICGSNHDKSNQMVIESDMNQIISRKVKVIL